MTANVGSLERTQRILAGLALFGVSACGQPKARS